MRTCPSCARNVPDDRDFCRCGAYLAWELDETPHPVVAGSTGSTAVLDAIVLDLRLPEEDVPSGGTVTVSVEPGASARLYALVRNQTRIVDSFVVEARRLPAGWTTATPRTLHLIPYGAAAEGYEREVAIDVHPPRVPASHAGTVRFDVVATSVTTGAETTAPAAVVVERFVEVTHEVRPQQAAGRRRAGFVALVRNGGNAPVVVDLAAADAEEACRFAFSPPSPTIGPGETVRVPFRVVPRRPLPIGRSLLHRFEVAARARGEAEETRPLRGATYRQRPWIAWWLPLVLLLLVLAIVLIVLLWPKRVEVPDLTRAKGPFAAKERLEAVGLELSPQVESRVVRGVRPGTILDQAPEPGERVPEGKEVSILVARASGKVEVPDVRGLRPAQADRKLAEEGLTLGAVTPTLDPRATIRSQVPPPGEERPRDTPVNVVLRVVRVPVPGLTHHRLDRAEELLSKRGLRLGRVTPADATRRARIASQIPKAGERRPRGTRVNVVMVRPKAKVPDVGGCTLSDAEAALAKAGLKLGDVRPDKDPKAVVRNQIPAAGARRAKGATVDVVARVPPRGKKRKKGAQPPTCPAAG